MAVLPATVNSCHLHNANETIGDALGDPLLHEALEVFPNSIATDNGDYFLSQ
jgi:hypothetical protein